MGVNILFALAKGSSILDPSYDVEIVEMHHRNKVDAPSGTALGLGSAVARGRKTALNDVARFARQGNTGIRPAGEIGFAALRGGDVVGDHTVIFAADGERLELTHKASSRAVFANGAIRAALWARGKPAGLIRCRMFWFFNTRKKDNEKNFIRGAAYCFSRFGGQSDFYISGVCG